MWKTAQNAPNQPQVDLGPRVGTAFVMASKLDAEEFHHAGAMPKLFYKLVRDPTIKEKAGITFAIEGRRSDENEVDGRGVPERPEPEF